MAAHTSPSLFPLLCFPSFPLSKENYLSGTHPMLLAEACIRNAFKHVEARCDLQCEGRYNTEKKKPVHSSIKSNNDNLIGSFI